MSDDANRSLTECERQRRVLLDCLEQYISGRLSRSDAVWYIAGKIYGGNVADDDLVTAAYIAVSHLTEENYWTVEEEIRYLYECLKSEKVYSQAGLNSAISSTDSMKHFYWSGKVGGENWLTSFIEASYRKFQSEQSLEHLIGLIAHYLLEEKNIGAEDRTMLMGLISALEDVLFCSLPSEQPNKVTVLYQHYLCPAKRHKQ